MSSTWSDVVAFATSTFPGTEASTSWGAPSLKAGGKLFARLRTEKLAHGALVLRCTLSDKEALLAGGDPAFFTMDHYDGHPFVLVDLDVVDPDELRELVTEAWLLRAPARLRQEWEGR